MKIYKFNELYLNAPKFIDPEYEVLMGSISYGVDTNLSDVDIYGFCIPPKEYIFPENFILGYDKPKKFEVFQQHHIEVNNQLYDISIYSIIKYFSLLKDNNPNILDSLFVNEKYILNITDIGRLVKSNRWLFLSKKLYYKFSGYAYSQKAKLLNKSLKRYVELCNLYKLNPLSVSISIINNLDIDLNKKQQFIKIFKQVNTHNLSKRINYILNFGYDVKFAYHIIRLLKEAEQLLKYQDLDLEAHKNLLIDIRQGKYTLNEILELTEELFKQNEELFKITKLPEKPREKEIRDLLIKCLKKKGY